MDKLRHDRDVFQYKGKYILDTEGRFLKDTFIFVREYIALCQRCDFEMLAGTVSQKKMTI